MSNCVRLIGSLAELKDRQLCRSLAQLVLTYFCFDLLGFCQKLALFFIGLNSFIEIMAFEQRISFYDTL